MKNFVGNEGKIKVDKYELVQQLVKAKYNNLYSVDDIVGILEKNISDDIRRDRYSSSVYITASQQKKLNEACRI